jgi:hypothetical protein
VTALVGAAIRGGDDGGDGGADETQATGARRPTTILFGHRGGDGRVDLLVLAGADGRTASVLLLPTATQVEVPSLGPQALSDIPNDGDTSALATTVENLLGVRVVRTVMLDDTQLNAVLDAAQPIPIELARPVQFDDAESGLVAAGAHEVSGEDAARLLVSTQDNSELDRLVTVQGVLDGWLTRLRDRAAARRVLAAEPGLQPLLTVARAGEHRTDTLPVEQVATGGEERFEPRVDDLARYVSVAFDSMLLGRGVGRPRVEILNGTGAVGLAQTIASRVVPAGGQVTLSGNAPDFTNQETQVIYYRDGDRREARRLLAALGCGSLRKAQRPVGIVDVTILAGADCFRTGTPGA